MDPLPSTDIIAPALFIGHGAPFYAIKKNPFTPTWANFMKTVPSTAVTAIIVISAHWYEPGLAVTANERPETIHDFGGFEQALHEVQYPAKGSPSLCQKVAELLFPEKVEQSLDWGYDHGAWTILMHTHPKADIPVIQLRLDQSKSPAQLFELGRKLAPLRRQGVMILGSGNVSHNLRQARFDMFGDTENAADWNKRFTTDVQKWILTKDWQSLQNCSKHPDFKMASPSPDHFLPILVIAGASEANDQVKVITEGYDAWSLSMNSYAFVPQYGKPETKVEL
ncbi:hypothetical protein FGO68_gene1564 [Halteria grandinella]|uniref:Extradiol ring-cleavage dioxygenase class III enzyme subunit B domain-containing protein n=1 Tax=Halteria grandinella TaxID=5974 RepID=A0A8J8SWQ0_HALGN|nr:hypothetical protein FGO68_gene1564 [Halteria grandinella]